MKCQYCGSEENHPPVRTSINARYVMVRQCFNCLRIIEINGVKTTEEELKE